MFLKNQTAWDGNEDITLCVKNVAYYRQFVSLEIYKIVSTPFPGCGVVFFSCCWESSPRLFCLSGRTVISQRRHLHRSSHRSTMLGVSSVLSGSSVRPWAARSRCRPRDIYIYIYISEKGPFCWLPHRGSASPPCHPLQNIHFDIGEQFFKWAWPGGRSWHGASTLAANVFVEEW